MEKIAGGINDDMALALYMNEISRFKPLPPKEEAQLSAKIRTGDRKALVKLLVSNLRFVVSVARNYQHQGLPLIDLINEGNIGLIRAARKFDETKNFKFISYAVWWIRQSILQALAEQSRIVNLPLNRVGTIYKIGQALKKLEQRKGRQPEAEEIADELGLTLHEVRDTLKIGDSHVSLDAPFETGEDSCLMDMMVDKANDVPDVVCFEHALQDELRRTLSYLPDREQRIVSLYYGIGEENPHTLEEIGERFNLTRERARQIKENALRRLRNEASIEKLRTYA